VLDDPWHGRGGSITLRREYSAERIAVAPCDAYRLELDRFCRAVGGLEEPAADRDDAVGQARALDALMRAAATGTPQSVA
jgi:predicted dehydrogenase